MEHFALSADALFIVALLLSSLTFGIAASILAAVSDSVLFERMLLEWADAGLYPEETAVEEYDEAILLETIPAISYRKYFAA